MAIGINVNGKWLKLYDDTKVSFEEVEDFTSNSKVVNRPVSKPFTIPTMANKDILSNFHRPESYASFKYIEDVYVYIGSGMSIGVVKYYGTLHILRSNALDTECSFVSNEYRIKELTFAEIDMGIYEGPVAAVNADGSLNTSNPVGADHKSIASNPDIYNHVIVPVIHRNINSGIFYTPAPGEDPVEVLITRLTNRYYDEIGGNTVNTFYPWDVNSGDYLNASPFTPFLKVGYIFERIGSHINYGIRNHIVDIYPELGRLYMYNNTDQKIVAKDDNGNVVYETWPDRIEYNRCVIGEYGVTEFISMYADVFFCGVFVNNIDRVIDIIPYKSIINAPYSFDFTDRLVGDMTTEVNDDEKHSNVSYALHDQDKIESYPPYYLPAVDYYGTAVGDGNYYDVSLDRYFTKKGVNNVYHPHIYRSVDVTDDNNTNVKTLKTRPMRVTEYDLVYGATCLEISMAAGEEVNLPRFFLFRGMTTTTPVYPHANVNGYDPDTNTDGYSVSLTLDRDNGIYNLLAKEWIEFLHTTKEVTMDLRLTIGDLTRLKPWHKIRVGSNHYLIKSKSIEVDMNGISLVRIVGLLVN